MSVVFKAEERKALGSAATKKIKKDGQIPAVIYDQKGNINISLNGREFEKEYSKGNSYATVVEIELSDKKIKAVAHKIELDPVSDRPIHVDFVNCTDLKAVTVKPKIIFSGREKCPGLKKGGFLNIVKRRVSVVFTGKVEDAPTEIEVDIAKMHLGGKILSFDLKLPEGSSLKGKKEFLVASIIGRGKSEESTKTEEGSEGESGEEKSEENSENKSE